MWHVAIAAPSQKASNLIIIDMQLHQQFCSDVTATNTGLRHAKLCTAKWCSMSKHSTVNQLTSTTTVYIHFTSHCLSPAASTTRAVYITNTTILTISIFWWCQPKRIIAASLTGIYNCQQNWLIEQGLTSHQTHIGDNFYRSPESTCPVCSHWLLLSTLMSVHHCMDIHKTSTSESNPQVQSQWNNNAGTFIILPHLLTR